ncbi:MAG: hypothetical protein V2I79_04750 [Xanthomonadales bacterium]|jgi:hypothetical protein|nr:hypothetical protein [Xanthomonadales bacterium]
MNMYEKLRALAKKPEPWSVSTVKELWTKPHLASQMLKYHLSQESEHSSRKLEVVGSVTVWRVMFPWVSCHSCL